MASLNPLDYKPSQIAKALIAALSSAIALVGVLAMALTDGGLATAGGWVAGVAVFLTPILVFLQKVQPWLAMLDGPGDASESE
ncbi:hypothetical protein [Nocardia wallacei]|uniref:hypothetical protein n=1 Tax=Nocardia wallacei TaxID=480035 RepID=UPI002454B7E0|nr:hypothetical protein [Nocardia wallacei]